jgi:2-amino-4-hydroxy-6-hydroxymethyldihydropteridine diphosphokinase
VTRCFVGLGSNLGDRLANLHRAIAGLAAVEGLEVTASSRVYETAPVGPVQPDFLNAVLEVRTRLSARGLLAACLDVEAWMGRVRGERWGPRVIDLDLLAFGRAEIHEPGLDVPHLRMHERAFVLIPLLELEPDPPLPGGRRIGTLRPTGVGSAGVRLFGPALPTGNGLGPMTGAPFVGTGSPPFGLA